MLETPHVAVAAAIATKIPNPLLAIPLAFASHFILDMIPHWNPHINREIKKFGKPTRQSITIIRVDSVVALAGGILIATQSLPNSHQFLNVLACCFVSVLPDVVEAPYYFFGKKDKMIEKWITWQKSIQSDASPLIGISTQVITVLVSLWWIFT